ncbi:hypothetical protein [Pedosphaera parvula]|uniref:Uncharacterized protein n=1 Tax=Pedosphaera parvula (strain Ellin514) TaxID=320771 RepID=B9XM28_PEDPL|nr:hypothetical protein [Pedosphaera parvula]EEF59156.1 hypothetical protein Cflav_PD1648 [Pedosphaera parvula Ellin514]
MTDTQTLPHTAKRVIRHQATGLYFVEQEGGGWANSPDAATKYERLGTMVEVCRRFGLEDVDLVLKMEGGEPVEMVAIS